MKFGLVSFFYFVLALLAGCASSPPATKTYVPVPSMAGLAPMAAVPNDEIANRQAYITAKEAQRAAITKKINKVMNHQLRDANNNRTFVLGTGAVGIGCGIAVSALAAAAPGANIVWITALSGVGSGAMVFQTQAALQGLTVQAVVNARQTYVSNVTMAASSFSSAMVSLGNAVNDPNRSAWTTAVGQVENSLFILNLAAKEPIVGTQSGSSGTLIFVTQPFSPPVKQNNAISLTAVAGSPAGNTIQYQWQLSTDNGVAWTPITAAGGYNGFTTSKLTFTPTALSPPYNEYRCVATDSANNTATSMSVVLVVVP